MAAVVTIRVDFNRLRGASGKVRSRLEQAVDRGALTVQAGAMSRAPVDTGALRASIHTTGGGLSREVNSGVFYAIYQEFGTRYQSGTAHMRPAAEAARPAFEAACAEAISGIA